MQREVQMNGHSTLTTCENPLWLPSDAELCCATSFRYAHENNKRVQLLTTHMTQTPLNQTITTRINSSNTNECVLSSSPAIPKRHSLKRKISSSSSSSEPNVKIEEPKLGESLVEEEDDIDDESQAMRERKK